MEAQARAVGRPTPVFEPHRRLLRERPRIVVALDVSGSIDSRTLRLFAGEIGGLLRRSGAEARLITFDTEIHLDLALSPDRWQDQLAQQPLRTGGGTDFAQAIARAARYDPSIAVVLTDLEGPTGPAPKFPLLWVTPCQSPAPPFGRVVTLDET